MFHIMQDANSAVDEVQRAEFFRKGGAHGADVSNAGVLYVLNPIRRAGSTLPHRRAEWYRDSMLARA